MEVARAVLSRVKPLGQSYLNFIGDLSTPVSRLAVGTGAITQLPPMSELGADILLATDVKARDGLLYDADGSGSISSFETLLRTLANELYSAINEGSDI